MKKTGKILALSILLSMVISTTVLAASINATLTSGSTQVKTEFNTGNAGYHTVKVTGWEYYDPWKKHNPYSKEISITGGGTMNTAHYASNGCIFKRNYNGENLISKVYYSGVEKLSAVVSY